jgi:hypothetical protein
MEKDLLPIADKESMESLKKAVSSLSKGSMEILFYFLHVHTLGSEHITGHAQFKVIVRERKMADPFLDMLNPGS